MPYFLFISTSFTILRLLLLFTALLKLFSFKPEYDDKIIQKLKLIRKDYRNKMNNKHTSPRITDPGSQPSNTTQNFEPTSDDIIDISGLIQDKNIQFGY